MGSRDQHAHINVGEGRPGRGHNLLVPPRLLDRIDYVATDDLQEYRRNARTHPKKQIRKLCDGIAAFGFLQPTLIDEDGTVVTGHARLMAARQLGYTEVPVIRITHLSSAEIRAFRIADNRIVRRVVRRAGPDRPAAQPGRIAILILGIDRLGPGR